jgi:hypothetical protein
MTEHQSIESMQAEMKKLNAEYERNRRRMAALQRQLLPKLSRLSDLAGQRNPIPHMDTHLADVQAERIVRGASGALTELAFPSPAPVLASLQSDQPKPTGRVHVNLRMKHHGITKAKKGGRSRKVHSQRRNRSGRRH